MSSDELAVAVSRLSEQLVEVGDEVRRLHRRLDQFDEVEPERPRLTVAEVAARLVVSRSWVYRHQAELGAKRIGSGPRAPLRFDPDLVDALIGDGAAPAPAPANPRRHRRRRNAARGDLLPIRESAFDIGLAR